MLARQAQEADAILSAARVKVHSQMLLTLACKNLFGIVPGLRKARHHGREGRDPDAFADMLASLVDCLPPVSAVLDGVVAMHVADPAGGKPYARTWPARCQFKPRSFRRGRLPGLGQGSSGCSPAAGLHPQRASPLQGGCEPVYPRLRPEDFSAEGFVFPSCLQHTSFLAPAPAEKLPQALLDGPLFLRGLQWEIRGTSAGAMAGGLPLSPQSATGCFQPMHRPFAERPSASIPGCRGRRRPRQQAD